MKATMLDNDTRHCWIADATKLFELSQDAVEIFTRERIEQGEQDDETMCDSEYRQAFCSLAERCNEYRAEYMHILEERVKAAQKGRVDLGLYNQRFTHLYAKFLGEYMQGVKESFGQGFVDSHNYIEFVAEFADLRARIFHVIAILDNETLWREWWTDN